MHLPEFFCLIEESVVSVCSCEDVGEESQPDVLSKKSMSFEERAEFSQYGHDVVLFGALVDKHSE